LNRAELGARAELAVADFLYASGFDLLAQNLRLGHLEIDVVARQGPLLVMTEVRARGPGALVGPFASITRTKRARLFKAAHRLWRRHPEWTTGIERVRLDVAAVHFIGRETQIEYIPGALG
jgi:putative endonuclease